MQSELDTEAPTKPAAKNDPRGAFVATAAAILLIVAISYLTCVIRDRIIQERLKGVGQQELMQQVWYDGYTQCAIDAYYGVPQVVVQLDGDKLSVWKKTESFDPPADATVITGKPELLPALPEKKKK